MHCLLQQKISARADEEKAELASARGMEVFYKELLYTNSFYNGKGFQAGGWGNS